MKLIAQPAKLPAILSAGSFLCLMGVMTLSSPITNVIFAAIFFLFLLIFLVSTCYLAVALQKGKISAKEHYRIVVVSLSIIILLMFRSSQSLSLVDALILVLAIGGIVFYADRRF